MNARLLTVRYDHYSNDSHTKQYRSWVSSESHPAGTTVNDRYVLQRKLGTDGHVYEAHDRHLDQVVALKFLHPVANAPQSWDEAKRLEQLRSRFIVPVINADVILNSDLRFIVTQLLPNGDLENEARPHGLQSGLAARLGQHIALGLEAVHDAGLLHRDIKPGNALLDGDTALVSDVEFCGLIGADGLAPRTGSWCTLAPEVAPENGLCSVASDVYSLAATVFYLLSGEYPVDCRLARTEQQQLLIEGRLRQLSDLAPHVPRAIVSVVKRGMNLDPSLRPKTAAEFGNALATASAGRVSWGRVVHEDHDYCAETAGAGTGKSLAVCAVPTSDGMVRVRAFHRRSGRAINGKPEKEVSTAGLAAALRSICSDH